MPAADEVWRLQNDSDPECEWFRTAVRGKPGPIRGSMQGIYVLSPGGRSLGRLNSNNPDAVLAMLERSLTAWHDLPPDARRRRPEITFADVHRWEHSYPDSGLVLERFARDIGDDAAAEARRPVNRDAVWFTCKEARGLVPASKATGAVTDVAPLVVERLARVCLVDNVRGQTLPFVSGEVVSSTMRSEVLATNGALVELRLTGATRAVAKGPWLGGDNYWRPKRDWPRQMVTRIVGTATYDTDEQRFVSFELVALGERRGRTAFNGRHREPTESSHAIGFLLRLAPSKWRVAPTFINVYDVDWVTLPSPAKK